MTEDSVASTVSSASSAADNNNNGNNNSGSQTRQRKKRKWDEPAETIVSAAVALPGFVPLGTVGSLLGVSLPGVPAVSGALLTNPVAARCAISPPAFQVPSVPQGVAATVVPKQNQLNIQDELIIAREIVINDSESSVRYKLTKRQTQEEIQKCTGAVVITRGKYHPPNAPSDGDKPLYLHISAGAHLKDTAERILAVDRAAAMVEEMIRQGQNSQPTTFQTALSNGVKALSTCVFLGFDADPSLNIAARIRGPNDQYINHIMNETGSSVVLRGHGSGNSESLTDTQQPLHLFLSASHSKSLEDAKRLAENLLDTISVECGASRVSSCKVYSAVPAPPQLLAGVHSSGNEHTVITSSAPGLTTCTPSIPASSVAGLGFTHPFPQGTTCGQPQTNLVSYPQPLVTKGTSYTGYGGIYPQATPLQQVAQALRQSSSPIVSTVGPATSAASTASKPSTSSISDKEKRPTPKRKFKELSISSKGPANAHQGSQLVKHGEQPSVDLGPRSISTMPAPVKLVQQSTNGMRPPPHRTTPPPPPPPKFTSAATPKKLVQPSSSDMPPPPSRTMSLTPPPKFTSASPVTLHGKNSVSEKTKAIPVVSDTLFKLMEYGEDDDDLEESSEESSNDNSNTGVRKPFWAV